MLDRRRTRLALAAIVALLAVPSARADPVGPRRAMTLLEEGTIEPLEQLNQTALADHPRGTIVTARLDWADGRYLYRVRLRDARGRRWRVCLNAANGDIVGQIRASR